MGSAERIAEVAKILLLDAKQKKSVVVSAMSGTTDSLLSAGQLSKRGEIDAAKKVLLDIRDRHFNTLHDLVKKKDLLEFSRHFISGQIQSLSTFLEAISVIGEISPRSHDQIVAVGEKLAAHLLTMHLRDIGIDSEFVNLEAIAPEDFSEASRDFFEETKKNIFDRITPLIERGAIPVITGFFGRIPGGIVSAVGRGYSDFTASLVGAACDADEIQIWTDVDGILSADPRIVSDPITLKELSFDEASELANFGAKVIHPQTIWPAVKRNIPVRIKNTMNPKAKGTRITREGEITKSPFKSVTAKRGVTVVMMEFFEIFKHGFMEKVFQIFSKYRVPIDLISTSEASVSVTIERTPEDIKACIAELRGFSKVSVCDKKAILAIIGEEMSKKPGTAGKVFTALGKKKINLQMISQGASELNISMVIDEEDIKEAIFAIHHEFFPPHK
jgi:aspartate kinase